MPSSLLLLHGVVQQIAVPQSMAVLQARGSVQSKPRAVIAVANESARRHEVSSLRCTRPPCWRKTCILRRAPRVLLLIAAVSAYAANPVDPDALLARADHLVEIGNSVKAKPLYAEAEQEFHARGRTRKGLYIQFGRLHREIETGSYALAAQEVECDLHNAVVQSDPMLKIARLH